MISDKRRLQIANVCYANIAGEFAIFCNDEMRGPNFKWENFSNMMAVRAGNWMIIHNIGGNEKAVRALAEQYAREIADRLVGYAGFVKTQ